MIHFVTFYFQPQGSNVTIMMYGITGLNPNNKYAVLIFLCMYVHRTFEHKKSNVILWKSLYKRKVGFFLHDFYKKLLASTNAFLDRRAAKKIYIRVIQKVEKNWRSIVRSRPFIADTDHWSSCDLWSGNTLSSKVVNEWLLLVNTVNSKRFF